ncbi:hypothetical protein Tco_1173988 [Tanacetum coccineum]
MVCGVRLALFSFIAVQTLLLALGCVCCEEKKLSQGYWVVGNGMGRAGKCTREVVWPRNHGRGRGGFGGKRVEVQDMALPPRDQRHQYLRYEGLQYTDADISNFESRLTRIYRREVHRVQVFDFGGLPDLMTKGLSARMLMEHRDAKGAPEKVTETNLFYLRGMDVGSVNVPYLLAKDLRLFAAGRKSRAHISGGQFVICEQLDDTWAWLAIGPERQPDAAAGTPRVSQDAPVIDEGGQADLAPIRGTLAEQREVIGAMAHDFSRLCTWTTTSLAQMMDRVSVIYTSYSQTLRKYQRHRASQRTGEASTSTTQQDPQQPDL